jgi:hypothetical protein
MFLFLNLKKNPNCGLLWYDVYVLTIPLAPFARPSYVA